jgi:hypothetical protein
MKFNQDQGGKTNAIFLLVGFFGRHWDGDFRSSELDCDSCANKASYMEI